MGRYQTILADPPWPQNVGFSNYEKHKAALTLPYSTMTIDQIKVLPINDLAEVGCHLWLWTTNQFLQQGFEVMQSWGFKYLAPITWVKPSGMGNYFVHVTQTLLFGYKERCLFPLNRYMKTVLMAELPRRHSEKPAAMVDFIEGISPAPRLELFSRRKRMGWDVWGNEVNSDLELAIEHI